MGLRDSMAVVEANAATASPRGRCIVARIRDTFTGDDLAYFDEIMDPISGKPGSLIAVTLREEGHAVSSSSIRNHRARRCACYGLA